MWTAQSIFLGLIRVDNTVYTITGQWAVNSPKSVNVNSLQNQLDMNCEPQI